jgi:A/G-specific adenine glycosylase
VPSISNKAFQRTIYAYYKKSGRVLPWRSTRDPYRILVSEVMLQQTQVARVLPKYAAFIDHFPSVKVLARARFSAVLSVWQGLGYNRRALYLHQLSKKVIQNHHGSLPRAAKELQSLPGIGPTTAASILAFAFNTPVVFIETNIRSVYLHFFFPGKSGISDHQLLPLIEQTLDRKNSREWYWALFDYGVMLKAGHPNPSRASKHYVLQSPYQGSRRQARAVILRAVLQSPGITQIALRPMIPNRYIDIIQTLVKEGFIFEKNGKFYIQK